MADYGGMGAGNSLRDALMQLMAQRQQTFPPASGADQPSAAVPISQPGMPPGPEAFQGMPPIPPEASYMGMPPTQAGPVPLPQPRPPIPGGPMPVKAPPRVPYGDYARQLGIGGY